MAFAQTSPLCPQCGGLRIHCAHGKVWTPMELPKCSAHKDEVKAAILVLDKMGPLIRWCTEDIAKSVLGAAEEVRKMQKWAIDQHATEVARDAIGDGVCMSSPDILALLRTARDTISMAIHSFAVATEEIEFLTAQVDSLQDGQRGG